MVAMPSVNVEVFSIALQHAGTGRWRWPWSANPLSARSCWLAWELGSCRARGYPSAFLACLLAGIATDVERMWPLTHEAIANHRFQTLDELQEAQAQRCVALQNDASGIRYATLFRLQAYLTLLNKSKIREVFFFPRR